jgi:pimeloyl-ACP methyl ester carboxylesterase
MTTIAASAARGGGFIDAGTLRTYYELRGTGDPLLLLHGGMCTVETLDGLAAPLSQRYQVVLPERRGHGRTPDVAGPITYDLMAEDTIGFVDALRLSRLHVAGWSDGAVVGLLVALRRPDLVRSLVLIGQGVSHDGDPDEMREMLAGLPPDAALPIEILPPMLQRLYAAVSPDGPDHFPVVFERLSRTWRTEPSIPLADLAGVSAPTLVMVADDDMVTIAHANAMRRALPRAQLAVVPGATHGMPMEEPDIVAQLILRFLGRVDTGAPGTGS